MKSSNEERIDLLNYNDNGKEQNENNEATQKLSYELPEIHLGEAISNATPPQRERLMSFLSIPQVQFVIPIYQRYYTWGTTGKKQHSTKQFMDDFESIVSGRCTKHFLGILIYLERGINANRREFSIIDGQQRLVTTYLMLFALKKMMENDQDYSIDNRENFERTYFYQNPYVVDKRNLVLKLKPQVSDDAVYEKIANNEKFKYLSAAEKKSPIYINYMYILNRLTEIESKYNCGIERLVDALQQFYIVYIPVSLGDYPQKIFESLNNYGAKLNAVDLIRNFILMQIEDDLQERLYGDYWKEIEKCFSADVSKMESFFQSFISAKRRVWVTTDVLFDDFVDWYNEEKARCGDLSTVDFAERVLDIILRSARNYIILFEDTEELIDPSLKQSVNEYRNMPSNMPMPLFLELYNMVDDPNLYGISVSYKQVSEIINCTTIYLMRRWLCGWNTNAITTLFVDILEEIVRDIKSSNDPKSFDIVECYKRHLVNENDGNLRAMPNDRQVREDIEKANMYAKKKYVMVFFKKFENHNNPAPVKFVDKMSIEHLMPQTPDSEGKWLEQSGAKDLDDYNLHLHMLGNLSLGTPKYQSKALNNLWEYKQNVLQDTAHFRLNLDLLSKTTWNIDEIEKRTQDLINSIIELYPYFCAPNSSEIS